MSTHDTKVLTKQRDILLQKLEDFENTNGTLRTMLREQHRAEVGYKGEHTPQRPEDLHANGPLTKVKPFLTVRRSAPSFPKGTFWM